MATEKSGHVIACTIAIDAEGDIVAIEFANDHGLSDFELTEVFARLCAMFDEQGTQTAHNSH